LQIAANVSVILEPFLPFSMKKLRSWLNHDRLTWNDAGRTDLMEPGSLISNPGLLFEKIGDEEINKQIDRLMATKKSNNASAEGIIPARDPVAFDDFARLDIRTATVLEAEKVPETSKLLRLKIDTGIDVRTIVSGIAEYYEPESITGKQISVIANLEPRKIKGIESKGMILMAEDINGKLVIVSPEEKVNNGSIIR